MGSNSDGSNVLTLADWAKRRDPKGKTDIIVEMLSQKNEILDDMLWREANSATGHKSTQRTGLPQAYWRKLNQGVPTSKSTTVQIMDTTGMLEVYSEVDKALADLEGDTSAFRLSESKAFLAGMSNQFAGTLIYGDTEQYPERFNGLAPRFNDLSAASGRQIINAGGTGLTNTSMWFVTWGESTAFGIFPKGSKAGITQTDKGQQTVNDANGNRFEAYLSHFKWDCGLTVRDWRYISRIANIDTTKLPTAGQAGYNGPDLINMMIDAYDRVEDWNSGKGAIYASRQVKTALTKLAQSKANVNLTIENFAGKPITMFYGIPIKRVDAILNTEAQVV